jgi:hypothetical protein
MKKTIAVILVFVLVIGAAFADFKFNGGAKVVWGYNFAKQETTVSGRDGNAAANMILRVTGDYFSFNFGGALYSRSSSTEGINARITLRGKPLFKEAGIEIEKLDQLDFLIGNQIIRSNKVYADPLSRDDGAMQLLIATNSKYFPAGIELGTKNWTVKFGGSIIKDHEEIGGNLRLQLLDGAVWVEAGYAYNSETEYDKTNRLGHKFEDGGNGHRAGASFAVDIAKFIDKEDINLILSGDVQLNFSDSNANAYMVAAVFKKDSFFFGAEYRNVPKTIEKSDTELARDVRISAVEGKASYKFTEAKLTPQLEASAGYVFSRKSISDDFEDKGFIWTASGSVTILGLTVKLGYTHSFCTLTKYDDKSDKAYIELNFKF